MSTFGAGHERDLVADGIDGRHLGRIDHQHREPGDRRAVGVPGVDVAVQGGGDDLEVAVAVEVAERRRRGEPRLGPVVLVLVGGSSREYAGFTPIVASRAPVWDHTDTWPSRSVATISG